MAYFSKAYLQFFKDLAANNTREWFQDNKKVYEKEVKQPFQEFTATIIDRISKEDNSIAGLQPKEVIFRINRDIRFSEDKSPYKTHMGANITRGGRKSMGFPGFYYQLGPEAFVAGGAYMPAKDELQRIREMIAQNPKMLDKIVQAPKFKKVYKSVQGEKNKRLPKEFQAIEATQPLIANKQFYFQSELDPALITKDDFPERLMEYYMAGKEFNQYLQKAYG